jgi:hypothetical protein
MAFSGGWKRAQQTQREPMLHNPIDPAHLQPIDEEQVWWEDTSGSAPGMPEAVIGEQHVISPGPAKGYLDLTPQGGDFGMPAFPGFTIEEGQAVRAVAHSQDFGSVAARKYVSPKNRDGDYNIDDYSLGDTRGTSDEQNEIRWNTGVDAPSDFGANKHRTIRRWRDRTIDYHFYNVEMNPSYVRTATPAREKPMVLDGRNQSMSPFAAGDIYYQGDSFLVPTERRTPPPWDQSMTEEGIAESGADFALGSWGL